MASRTTPFHSIGGMQSISWDLAREFVRQGHNVTFLTTQLPDGGPNSVVRNVEGVSLVFLARTTPEAYDGKWWRASQQYAVAQLIGSVDAVLSVSAAAASLLPIRERFSKPIPFVFQAHGTSWGEVVSKWSTGRPLAIAKSIKNIYWLIKDATIYPKFDHIVAVGDELGRSFSHFPLTWMTRGTPCSTIVNGVDTSYFGFDALERQSCRDKLGLNQTDKVVIFAARLHAQKGCMEALHGFKHLAESQPSNPYKMIVVGQGEELERLREHSQTSKLLRDKVVFTGGVKRDEVPGLLSASDAFIFPTLRREGLPMNVLEALASGLPVITSPSLKIMLQDLDVRYAEPKSPVDIANQIKLVLDGEIGERDLTNRPPKIPVQYTLSQCAQRYCELMA